MGERRDFYYAMPDCQKKHHVGQIGKNRPKSKPIFGDSRQIGTVFAIPRTAFQRLILSWHLVRYDAYRLVTPLARKTSERVT